MAWKLTDNFKGRFNRIGHIGKKKEAHPCWKGGKVIDRDGYVRIWSPEHPWPRKGYMMDHVRVIELIIGRRILPNECVHHIDHNRQNNSFENLKLLTRSNHSKQHRREDVHKFNRDKKGRFAFKCGYA